MLLYNSSHFQTPGDIGPPAGTYLSLFFTPGDIGRPAGIPSQLGLKRLNTDTTNIVPGKLKQLHTFAKQKVTKQQLTNVKRQKKIVSLCLRK